jgi:hypothetical protein
LYVQHSAYTVLKRLSRIQRAANHPAGVAIPPASQSKAVLWLLLAQEKPVPARAPHLGTSIAPQASALHINVLLYIRVKENHEY